MTNTLSKSSFRFKWFLALSIAFRISLSLLPESDPNPPNLKWTCRRDCLSFIHAPCSIFPVAIPKIISLLTERFSSKKGMPGIMSMRDFAISSSRYSTYSRYRTCASSDVYSLERLFMNISLKIRGSVFPAALIPPMTSFKPYIFSNARLAALMLAPSVSSIVPSMSNKRSFIFFV